MHRLTDWPRDLRWATREPLSGPRSAGAGASESLTGFVQTFASPFGGWRWQFSFPLLRGEGFRRFRGLALALHGGANAVRVPFCDPDGLRWAELGVAAGPAVIRDGAPWSNGLPWSNGRNWRPGRPTVPVGYTVSRGGDVIRLVDEWWGARLDVGDMIGFAPFHLGLYFVTEVQAPGLYRIWPPLRAQMVGGYHVATLEPVLAMRLESESGASAGRGVSGGSGLSLTLAEVEDADIRAYYS